MARSTTTVLRDEAVKVEALLEKTPDVSFACFRPLISQSETLASPQSIVQFFFFCLVEGSVGYPRKSYCQQGLNLWSSLPGLAIFVLPYGRHIPRRFCRLPSHVSRGY